ncbi:hypothetical protein TNCV_1902571 [Trichonephila clavipes]|nr:hypothetical protein TNCV_1902571 [Trichonephila clavipes]
MDGIPLDAAKIYTDGSRGETNTTGSGVLIEVPGRVFKFQRRNADHASVFRTELIPIMCGLSFINNIRELAFFCNSDTDRQPIIHPTFIELALYRPSRERSCGRPCEGGYQKSCGTGRPHDPFID